MRLCRARFEELQDAHQRHQEILMTSDSETTPIERFDHDVHPNSHLIVLDLDETIMDQRTFTITEKLHRIWTGNDRELGWAFNEEDLVLNVNQYEGRLAAERASRAMHHRSPYTKRVRRPSNVWIGIFRKDFMEFIAMTQRMDGLGKGPYDLMLYSAAISVWIYNEQRFALQFCYECFYGFRSFQPLVVVCDTMIQCVGSAHFPLCHNGNIL